MTQEKLTPATAIIIAGIIIAGSVFLNGAAGKPNVSNDKSLAAKIGLSSKKQLACIEAGTYKNKVQAGSESASRAMSHLPEQERGTPYNVIVNAAGVKVEVAGAQSYEVFKKTIDDMLANKITSSPREINLDPITPDDHILGNRNADIIIVEYTDMECPFCARVHPTLHKLVDDYQGKVAWVIRHFPLDSIHENARLKAEAAECAWAQGGDEAFFKYTDELFNQLNPQKPSLDTSTL